MRKVLLIATAVAASCLYLPVSAGQPDIRVERERVQFAQNSSCHSACAGQRATCERGCNAGGGSMLHVQACLVRCEQGQQACAARCR